MWDLIDRATAQLQNKAAAVRSDIKSEVDQAASRLNAHVAGVVTKLAIWVAAGILLAVSLGFATFAGYHALLAGFPPEQAAAIVAGIYLVLALIGASAAASIGKSHAPTPAPAPVVQAAPPPPPVAPLASPPSAAAAAFAGQPQQPEIARIADLLGSLGRTNEQAALLIASEAAKSLSPLQLIAAGLVAGFVFGRKLDLPGGSGGKGG